MASMIRALSLAFLPMVLLNWLNGMFGKHCTPAVQVGCREVAVDRLMVAVPNVATSERISPMMAAEALSASMRTASRRMLSDTLISFHEAVVISAFGGPRQAGR